MFRIQPTHAVLGLRMPCCEHLIPDFMIIIVIYTTDLCARLNCFVRNTSLPLDARRQSLNICFLFVHKLVVNIEKCIYSLLLSALDCWLPDLVCVCFLRTTFSRVVSSLVENCVILLCNKGENI